MICSCQVDYLWRPVTSRKNWLNPLKDGYLLAHDFLSLFPCLVIDSHDVRAVVHPHAPIAREVAELGLISLLLIVVSMEPKRE